MLGFISEYHTYPGYYGTLDYNISSLKVDIVGVDIPILVEDNNTSNCIIAIVAQDPLRVKTDEMLRSFKPNFSKPIVGTPFAYHYDCIRYPKTEVYRLVINGLLKKGYKVYVTDIWKSWDNKKTKVTRMGIWSNKNPHKNCLKEEFALIKPCKVILMGSEAQNKYKSINYPVEPIKVPHPSNANNGSWTTVGTNPQDKANYILNQV